jgi:hypothetical protein
LIPVLLFSFAVATATGAFLVSRLASLGKSFQERVLFCGISLFLGLGLHSVWRFVWLFAFDATDLRLGFALFDLLLLVLVAAAVRVAPRRPSRPDPPRFLATAESPWVWGTLGIGLAALGIGATVMFSRAQPHGAWDAWAIWNVKALWMTVGGADWSTFLTSEAFAPAHPDYPLQLPLSISRVWAVMGATPNIVPQTFGAGVVALIFVLLFVSVWIFRGPLFAAVAVAMLLAIPHLLIVGSSQYADVPVACGYLVCSIAIAHGLKRGSPGSWFAIAGVAAGTTLWTKNEGALFIGCVVAAIMVAGAGVRAGTRVVLSRVLFLAVGILPFLPGALVVKRMAPVNIIVSSQTGGGLLNSLLDPTRHQQIVTGTMRMLGSLLDPIVVIGFVAFVILRGRAARLEPAATLLLMLTFTAAGYYAVFLTTPYPLDWHVRSAADRLLIQLWPSLIFAALLASGRDIGTAGDQIEQARVKTAAA